MFGPLTEQHKKIISQARKHLKNRLAKTPELAKDQKNISTLLELLIGSLSVDELADHQPPYWAEISLLFYTHGQQRLTGE